MAKRLAKKLPELISYMQHKAHELEDPACSKCCPDCFYTLSTVLSDESVADGASQPACHDFWNACIVAVTTPRTAVELAALRRTLRTNAAKCPARRLDFHRYNIKADDADIEDPVHRFFHALYCCLAVCVAPGEGRRSSLFSISGPKKTFGTKSGRWPLQPNDLVPLGARQSAEMHLHWCCQLFSPNMVAYLQTVIVGCRSLVFPHVLESPLRERLVWLLVQMLSADLARDAFTWPATVPYVRPARPARWLRGSRSVMLAAGFIRTICDGPDASLDDIDALCGGFRAVLLPALSHALDVIAQDAAVDKTENEWVIDGLCRLAVRAHKLHPHGELHAHARAWQLKLRSVNTSTLAPIKILLNRRYYRRTCYGPLCTNGITESEGGKPLPLCAGCKFTQYCCKGCQMADWKRVTLPHKDLCPILRSLRPVLEKDTSGFEDVLLSLDWSKLDIQQFVLWLRD